MKKLKTIFSYIKRNGVSEFFTFVLLLLFKKIVKKQFIKPIFFLSVIHKYISQLSTYFISKSIYKKKFTLAAYPKNILKEQIDTVSMNEIAKNCQPLLNNILLTDIDYSPDLLMENIWVKDIITGIDYPPYKDRSSFLSHVEKNGGDLRLLWEINRLQILVLLAQGYVVTGSQQYLEKSLNIVTGWVEQNPYKQGVNWIDTQEVGIRMTSMLICRNIFQSAGIMDERLDNWEQIIREHAKYVFHNLSIGRKTHNHFLTELTSLFIFSAMVDTDFKHKYLWLYFSKCLLCREISKQINADGLSAEGSTNYTFFDYDAILLANHVNLNLFNNNLIDNQKIKVIAQVINDFSVSDTDFVKIGDADCGRYVRLDWEAGLSRLGWIPIINNCFLLNEDLLVNSRNYSELYWLHPEQYISDTKKKETLLESNDSVRYYRESGYVSCRYNDKQLFLRLGPPTENPDVRFTHTHSDFLSFSIFQNGEPIFIDPGTYTYLGCNSKRGSLRSAMQHNTVTLDNNDYLDVYKNTFGIPKLKTVVSSNIEEIENIYSIISKFSYTSDESVGREFFFNKNLDWLFIASFHNTNNASSMIEHYNVNSFIEIDDAGSYVVSNKLNNKATIEFIDLYNIKNTASIDTSKLYAPRYGVIENATQIHKKTVCSYNKQVLFTLIKMDSGADCIYTLDETESIVTVKIGDDTFSIDIKKYQV